MHSSVYAVYKIYPGVNCCCNTWDFFIGKGQPFMKHMQEVKVLFVLILIDVLRDIFYASSLEHKVQDILKYL
eukprot:jgi/Botrbrau1/1223/Bobra.0163s0030.1